MSLGWCFWHRGCFGCLICGQPVDLDFHELDQDLGYGRGRRASFRVSKTGNKMRDEIEEVRQGRKRKAMAVELDEIPVCRGCDTMLIETGAHREELGMFLGRNNVSQHDGGLGEARWKKLRRTHTETDIARTPRNQSPTSFAKARKLASLFEGSEEKANNSGVRAPKALAPLTISMNVFAENVQGSNKTITPARRRPRRRATEGHSGAFESEDATISTMGRDGSNDSFYFNADEIEANFPRIPRPPPVENRPLTPPPDVSPIYVSITDPINGPSFRPSPTKPIPRWMALLPSQRTTVSPPRSQYRTREPSLASQVAPKPFDWSAYRRSLHGSLDSDLEETIATPPPPAPLPSPSEHHPEPHTASSPANSLPTIPESARAISDSRRYAHTQSMTSETVYFKPPEFPCDFFQQAMGRRGVHDEDSLRRVTKSMKKGSLQAGHELFHKRTRSEASECLAEIVSLPRQTHEIELPVKVPEVTQAMRPQSRIIRDPRPKTASNAEFIERYNLAIEEEDRRSKERARSVRGSLERIRDRKSTRLNSSHWE